MGREIIENEQTSPTTTPAVAEQTEPVDPRVMSLPVIEASSENGADDKYWRSLNELSGSAEFIDWKTHEFPEKAADLLDPVSRRSFMKVVGASVALAGVSACVKQPEEKIIPYVKQPEQLVPGNALFFATSTIHNGLAKGVLVESHEGRPTRVQGNPDHPSSLGAADIFMQAEILQLYDPDRSQVVHHKGEASSWGQFQTALETTLARLPGGRGLRFLSAPTSSPTQIEQIEQILAKYPDARWYTYDPAPAIVDESYDLYDLSKADTIVSLDADLFALHPDNLKNSRDFATRRDPENSGVTPSRLYVAESSPTPTGSIADHRLAVRSTDIWLIASAIAAGVGAGSAASGALPKGADTFVAAIVDDLKKSNGNAVVAVGNHQPAAVRALVAQINQTVGSGTTRQATSPLYQTGNEFEGIRELVAEINQKAVSTLFILGCNPIYDAPADLEFAKAIESVALRIHHGLYADETAYLSHWHLPASHTFESWGDAVSYDGTTSIIQPLIAPLYGTTRSTTELLSILNGASTAKDFDVVKTYWGNRIGDGATDDAFRKAIHDGFVVDAGSTPMPRPTAPRTSADTTAGNATDTTALPVAPVPAPTQRRTTDTSRTDVAGTIPKDRGGIEVNIRPDPSIGSGAYSNNGWLQELPNPMTKLMWDNAVLMSPALANSLGVDNNAIVEIALDGRKVSGPVWITPGHADNSVTVHLGYGRTRSGNVGNEIGFSAYPLRTSTNPWYNTGAKISATGDSFPLVSSQDHWSLEGRNYYREVTLQDFLAKPDLIASMEHIDDRDRSFYDSADWEYKSYAWAMTIDLNRCTACNACVIACQSENNIPVIGKEQVANGREMHWIRIDRYFGGNPDDTGSISIHNQPVPCQQCEQAPCEVVCPVAATVHSAEGLNDMVYNRCVGTRYCANNCPYKVRRYNFLQYVDSDTEQYRLMRNPNVSVRTRGVMEKCTYCVQRINKARIRAKIADRPIETDSFATACQEACPTNAITFGDGNDAKAMVSQKRESKRNYVMLKELNTRPRTSYLARLRNVHESLAPDHGPTDSEHHS